MCTLVLTQACSYFVFFWRIVCARCVTYVVYSWWYSRGFVCTLCTNCCLPNTNEAAGKSARFTSVHRHPFSFLRKCHQYQQMSIFWWTTERHLSYRLSERLYKYVLNGDDRHYKASLIWMCSLS